MKQCNHIAVSHYEGKSHMCLLSVLSFYCKSEANVYYVGVCPEAKRKYSLKILKEFKRFPFCPKCGQKNDYKEVESNL
jgi:RNase P subunit RPR2